MKGGAAGTEAARLIAEAQAVDREHGTASAAPPPEAGAGPASDPGPTEAAPSGTAQELAALLVIVRSILGPFLPTLNQIYSDKNIKEIASKTAPVIDKHGWQDVIKLARWKEEIECAACVLPLATITFMSVKGDLANLRAAKAAAEKKPEEKPPAKSGLSVVNPGTDPGRDL